MYSFDWLESDLDRATLYLQGSGARVRIFTAFDDRDLSYHYLVLVDCDLHTGLLLCLI